MTDKEPEESVWDADQWLLNKLKNYKIVRGEFCQLWEKQGGRCLICRVESEGSNGFPQIDHCHTTGQVRGLLCRRCNVGLGMFTESPDTLLRAAMYVALCAGSLSPTEKDPQTQRIEIIKNMNRARREWLYEEQDVEDMRRAYTRMRDWQKLLEEEPKCT